MISFWQKNSLITYDIIIIGGGFTGLHLGTYLKKLNPLLEILILEKNIIPNGASSKNAGLACFANYTELLKDLQTTDKKIVQHFIQQRYKGIQLLRQKLGDQKIGFKQCGSYELIPIDQKQVIDNIQEVNDWIENFMGFRPFQIRNDLFKKLQISKSNFSYIIQNKYEGSIDTGLTLKNLIKLAQKMGILYLSGSKVIDIQQLQQDNLIIKVQSQDQQHIEFYCKQTALCVNANISNLKSEFKDFQPGRGQVIATEKIERFKDLEATYFYEEGYYYFRTYKGRLIIGGGRNINKQSENTHKLETTSQIIDNLVQKTLMFFDPPIYLDFNTTNNHQHKHRVNIECPKNAQKVKVDIAWSGIMGFWKNNSAEPIIKKINKNVYVALNCSGMGVALSANQGLKLAKIMINEFNPKL